MSARPYHRRFHSDALAGFMSLNLEERGAYQTLLDMMYDRQGPVLDNERLLAGYMQVSIRRWRALRETLIQKGKIFVTRDGQLYNSRAKKEIENDAKTARKLAENGSKGGRKRAENEKNPNENSESGQANGKPRSSLNHSPESIVQRAPLPPKPEELPAAVRAVMEAGGFVSPPPDLGLLRQWQELGANLRQDVLPVIATEAAQLRQRTGKAPRMLKLFDQPIREKLANDQAEIERLEATARRLQAAGGGG